MSLGDDRLLGIAGERLEAPALLELANELRERDPQRRACLLLAAHRVTEDDRGALEVKRPCGPAEVDHGGAGTVQGPLLHVIHLIGYPGRQGQMPGGGIPFPLTHPPADLAVRLVGRLRIRVVVQLGIPPGGIDLADAVSAGLDVIPEADGVGSVRKDGADSDDGDGDARRLGHAGCLTPAASRTGSR